MHPISIRPISILTFAALVLGALGTAVPAGAAPNLVRTLPNKMTVIVRENQSRPLASIQVWINAGSRDESRSERGAAAALAYLPFEETARRHRGEMPKEAASFGAAFGSESGYSNIIYNMTVPSRFVVQGLDILSDAVIHPAFNQYTVDQALAKARRDSRGALSAAGGVAINSVRAALYGDTPLGAPIHAPELEVAALKQSILERFYGENFVAENVTVVVDGDVESDVVADQIASAFQGLPTGKPRAKARTTVTAIPGPIVRSQANPPDAEGSVVTAGFRAPPWGTADAVALDVLMAVLVDAPGSRFDRRGRAGAGGFGAAAAPRSLVAAGGPLSLPPAPRPSPHPAAPGGLVHGSGKIPTP